MTTVTATEARKQLYKLLDDVSDSHEPVQITGKRGNAVLVGEDDWRAVQETLYLVSIPGMRESIIEGMATPVEELDGELRWCAGDSFTPSRPRRTLRSWPQPA
jgi:prevent-host-death family protein